MWPRNWLPSPSPREAPFDQAGHVGELDDGRGELLGFEQLAQARQPRVRHRRHPGIGGDGAEGVGGHFSVPGGQGIEDGGLAGVRQPDDAAGVRHCFPFSVFCFLFSEMQGASYAQNYPVKLMSYMFTRQIWSN